MAGVVLTDKEALGVYLMLGEQVASLDPTMSRLRKRIEDRMVRDLTVDEFEHPAALYLRLPEQPPSEGRHATGAGGEP